MTQVLPRVPVITTMLLATIFTVNTVLSYTLLLCFIPIFQHWHKQAATLFEANTHSLNQGFKWDFLTGQMLVHL